MVYGGLRLSAQPPGDVEHARNPALGVDWHSELRYQAALGSPTYKGFARCHNRLSPNLVPMQLGLIILFWVHVVPPLPVGIHL